MLEVYQTLKQQPGLHSLQLTLTDLYPNRTLAAVIDRQGDAARRGATKLNPSTRSTWPRDCAGCAPW